MKRESKLIDRLEAIDVFKIMISGSEKYRHLRLFGIQKMGKSRMLREYREIALREFNTDCAFIDLRLKTREPIDLLCVICDQIGIDNFPKFHEVYDNYLSQPVIKVEGIRQFLSVFDIKDTKGKSQVEHFRRRMLTAFIQDLKVIPVDQKLLFILDQFDEGDPFVTTWLNEHFMSAIYSFANIFIIFAGRTLPEPMTTYEDICVSYELPPVTKNECKNYCEDEKIAVSDNQVDTLHRAFKGAPGFFVETVNNLIGDY